MARKVTSRFPSLADGQAKKGFVVPWATRPRPVPPGQPLDDPRLYFNRELSWIDFNWRVLAQAFDARIPLLERVRFLAIAYANLDEFFRKRYGGLKRQEAAGVRQRSPDGRTPAEQLRLIREAIRPMYDAMYHLWHAVLRPALAREAGVHLLNYTDLSTAQRMQLSHYFRERVFPVLTPLAVTPGQPFPLISNLSLSLAVLLRHPQQGTAHFARVKIPTDRGRWVPLEVPLHFVPIEEVVRHHLPELFRGMEIRGAWTFRITRNADVLRAEEEAEDLIAMIAEELRQRRFAPVVRMELEKGMPPEVRQLLMTELELSEEDLYEVEGLLNLGDCAALADLDLPDFKYEPWEPVVPALLLPKSEGKEQQTLFDLLRKRDLLVHHPYESFTATVQRFLEEAASDPQVLAIKQTLYRTSSDSPIMKALMRAADQGKQVAVLVEVKARFDEENNLEWGQQLERAGVHVTYGIAGLKTHAKVTLVVREEADGLRTYSHIGTGNYNPETARLYADLGLLTSQPAIGYDLVNLFHFLTGYAPEQHYQKLLVAPRDLRPALVQLIRDEVRYHLQQGNGRIIAKMNGLDDLDLIQELYRASQAGVPIDLIVRGPCRLRPGLKGYSETIRVSSIIGRFLEHSRIYYFHHGGTPRFYIGSADWMRRNLDDRVEVLAPIENPSLQQQLLRILQWALEDTTAWQLQADGRYIRNLPLPETQPCGFQERLMHWARHHPGNT
jgi:polyphosphate kinase